MKSEELPVTRVILHSSLFIQFIAVVVGMLFCVSCKTMQYVPVETVKMEYRNIVRMDTLVRYDSIFIHQKRDTVWMEKYRYRYKNKVVRDTVAVRDSVRVPYPVEVIKEVNVLTQFQRIQIWGFRLMMLFFIGIIWWKLKITN